MSVPEDPTVRELALVIRQVQERQSEMSQNQREISANLHETARTLEGVATRLAALEDTTSDRVETIEEVRRELASALTRIDRLEQERQRTTRFLSWIFGGGLIAALTTIALLWKLFESFPAAKNP